MAKNFPLRHSAIVDGFVDIAQYGIFRSWECLNGDPITGCVIQPKAGKDGRLLWDLSDCKGERCDIGVEWDDERDICRVVVKYKGLETAPRTEEQDLQYWWCVWPRPRYDRVDDRWQGEWRSANDQIEVKGATWVHTFGPLTIGEIPTSEGTSVTYRRTLKLRMLFKSPSRPVIEEFHVYSDSTWREDSIDIEWGCESTEEEDWSGYVQCYNGEILDVEPLNFKKDDIMTSPTSWRCVVRGGNTKGIRAHVLYAEHEHGSNDRTICTVRTKTRSFSFSMNDVENDGRIYIWDYGVFISRTSSGINYDEFRRMNSIQTGQSIIERVQQVPEQSYEHAVTTIPSLLKREHKGWKTRGRYVVLGCDSNPQKFGLWFNGNIFLSKTRGSWGGKAKLVDTKSLQWEGDEIRYDIRTGDGLDSRDCEDGTEQCLLEGYLPIVQSTWKTEGIEYKEVAFAALLKESPWEEAKKVGDEPVVLLVKLEMTNMSEMQKEANIWLVIQPEERLEFDGGYLHTTASVAYNEKGETSRVQAYETKRLRCFIDIRGKGILGSVRDPSKAAEESNSVKYHLTLAPGENHAIMFKIPFMTLTDEADRRILSDLDYEKKLKEITEYWKDQVEKSMHVHVPDNKIGEFYRAVIPHVFIATDKDPRTGLYLNPAAALVYTVFANETCIQARFLDMIGRHDLAWKYLEPFVKLQGSREIPGRYKSNEGIFHGVKVDEEYDYTAHGYGLDHGWVIWILCEHYRFTSNVEWLKSITPSIVKACDWIINERKSTMKVNPDGSKVWEYGLLPAGQLEDNREWMYWFAVNSYAYLGLKNAGEVLSGIGHPDGERFIREADGYKTDILNSVKESIVLSPVVKVKCGNHIPHVPSRTHLRGRHLIMTKDHLGATHFLRDSIYGSRTLIDCGVVDPYSEEATWILRDLEDNLTMSGIYSFRVEEKDWFSRGGIILQPNLSNAPMIYLMRDQIPHLLRVFYNTFIVSLYRDVNAFCEGLEDFGRGVGPFYKTPDECAFLIWLRHLLLREEGESLMITPGAPRKWFEDGKEIEISNACTYFGTISYRITSNVRREEIRAVIGPPRRGVLKEIKVRFRHPEKKPIKSVTVNGKDHMDFDVKKEIITVTSFPEPIEIVAKY